MMKGQVQILAKHVPLDLIPTDFVVAGMILALAELVEGTAPPVYQFGASDVNPCSAQRFGEMAGMYKRKSLQRGGSDSPLLAALGVLSSSILTLLKYQLQRPRILIGFGNFRRRGMQQIHQLPVFQNIQTVLALFPVFHQPGLLQLRKVRGNPALPRSQPPMGHHQR